LGDVVYSIERRKLIEAGYLSEATVQYYRPEFDSKNDKFMTYQEIYKKHIVDNFGRNNLIINLADKYAVSNQKVLVLVSQIDHGQYLFDHMLSSNKIFLHGSTDKRLRNQNLDSFQIIVASNIFNEGVDLPALDCLIIAAGGKSSILLTQRIGRVLRPKINKALIIDFVDTPKYICEHYEKRLNILKVDFEVEFK